MADPQLPNEPERDQLSAYLDGELTEAEVQEVEAKLNRDPSVRAEADALRRTWDLLDYLPRPEASASFTHRTMERVTTMLPLSAAQARRRWLLGLSGVAALAIASVAGYAAAPWILPAAVEAESSDQQLVREQHLLERLHLYRYADDIGFLHELDQPDLFGEEHAGF